MRVIIFTTIILYSLLGQAQSFFPIKQGGKWGLMDEKGDIITKPTYEAVSLLEHGFYRIQQNQKIGLIDQAGKLVFKPIYQDLQVLSSELFIVLENDERKLVTATGKRMLNQQFDYAEIWNEHFIGFTHMGKWGAINHQGQVLVNPNFTALQAWENDFLLTGDSTGTGLIDKEGNTILSPNYQSIKQHNKSLFFYKEDGLWGLVNNDGKKLTPCQFLTHKVISAQKIILFPTPSYAAKPVLYSISQEKIISENQYDNYIDLNPQFTIYKEKGLLGIINGEGTEILQPRYQEIHVYQPNTFRALKNDKWGVVDSQEQILIPFQYDFISQAAGPLAVIKQGVHFGVVNMDGTVITPIEYNRIDLKDLEAMAYKGKALTILTYNEAGEPEQEDNFKSFGTIKVSQKKRPKAKEEEFELLDEPWENPYILENFEWFEHRSAKWGLRDRTTGEIKIPPTYNKIDVKKDLGFTIVYKYQETELKYGSTRFKHHMVAGLINNKLGYPSTQMNLLDIRLEDLEEANLPVARVVFTNGKHGLITKRGGLILENYAFIGEYNEGRVCATQKGELTLKHPKATFHNGQLLPYLDSMLTPVSLVSVSKEDQDLEASGVLQVENGVWGFLDTLGKNAIMSVYQYVVDFKNGTAIVQQNGSWGTIDHEGNEYLPISFSKINFESKAGDQLLRVYNKCSKYGMIDSSGRVNITIQYETIRPIHEQRIAVKKGGKWGFLSVDGQPLTDCIYEKAMDFSEGLAAVRYKRKWGFINTSGELVIPHKFRRVGRFREGMAWAAESSLIGFINKQGEMVIEGSYHQAGDFENGISIIRQSSSYGLIDQNGRLVVKPKYNKILPFQGEKNAIVRFTNGTYGLIDQEGNKVGSHKFQKIEPFSDGLAIVKQDNLFGLIDNGGTLIVEPSYTRLEPFVEGRGRFIRDGRWGFLDKNGQEVIEAQYSKCLDFNEGKAIVYFGYRNSGMIDTAGNYYIEPKLNRLLGFSEGRGLVRQYENRYYYVTKDGKLYKGFYENAGIFQNNAAPVKLNNRWGLINQIGIEICPPKFNKIGVFENGFASIHIKHTAGIAGLKGEIIIPPEYEYIQYVGNNLFRVESDNKVGYLDTKGKWVWALTE